MEKQKLYVYKNSIWYENLDLDEEEIKTEHYEDFWKTFRSAPYELHQLYDIEDTGNNPFRKIEQFIYRLNDEDDNDYVYVRRDYLHYSIMVGIRINSLKDSNRTTEEVIKTIYKYQELRKQIYDIFKKNYGVDNV